LDGCKASHDVAHIHAPSSIIVRPSSIHLLLSHVTLPVTNKYEHEYISFEKDNINSVSETTASNKVVLKLKVLSLIYAISFLKVYKSLSLMKESLQRHLRR